MQVQKNNVQSNNETGKESLESTGSFSTNY